MSSDATAAEGAWELPPPPKRRGPRSPELTVRGSAPVHAAGDSPPDEPLPQIEGYEVLEELGRGGMGVVYKARHLALGRLVALKMIQTAGLPRADQLRRFQTEAAAVARLRHPNVVVVYEVGAVAGRPYLALEFVDGGTLARRLDGSPYPAAAAVQLIATLADAVQYAHEQGIVHRDLKPANVLLDCRLPIDDSRLKDTSADLSALGSHPSAIGTPKIADFGLAKQIDADAGQTRSGVMIGTPSYMAPEQAAGRNEAVGPAADIYSLGAILYELLTGRPPFRGVSTLETVGQVLRDEPVPPRRLQPGVPRDLDTICLKCLSKEPSRRYASAAALAADLRAFLEGRPILARPVGRAERLARWCRRNPVPAALAAALALALPAGFGGVFWQWRRAEGEAVEARLQRDAADRLRAEAVEQRNEAARRRAEAEANLALARQSIDQFVGLVTYLDNTQLLYLNFLDVKKETLQAILAHYEGVVRQTAGDPARREDHARAQFRVAVFRRRLTDYQTALPEMLKALELFESLARDKPGNPQLWRDLAAVNQSLGFFYHALGRGESPADSARGQPYMERARTLRAGLLEAEPTNLDLQSELAGCYNDLGLLASGMKDYRQATAYQREAIRLNEAAARQAPHIARYRLSLLNHYFNLATALVRLGQPEEAVAASRQMLRLQPHETSILLRHARVLDQAAALVPAERSPDLRTAYLSEAVQSLREAVEHGFDDWTTLFRGSVLSPTLRTFPAFKDLMHELGRDDPAPKEGFQF